MPRRLRGELARLDYVAVLVVGREDGSGPTRVGVSREPGKVFRELQFFTWEPLRVCLVAWTAGLPVAERIEAEAHRLLEKRRRHGKWFDVPSKYATGAVLVSARKLRLPIFSHGEMLRRCAELERASMDRLRLPYFRTTPSAAQSSYRPEEPPPRKRQRKKWGRRGHRNRRAARAVT